MKHKNFLYNIITGFFFLLFSLSGGFLFGQSAQLVINGAGVYMRMNGGTSGTPIYVVIDNAAPTAIVCGAAGLACPASGFSSWIISEGQYNYVKWRQIAATTNVVPFGSLVASNGYLPVTFNKSSAGAADMSFSTWGTTGPSGPANVPWAGISDAGGVAAVLNMNCPSISGPVYDGSKGVVIDRWWDIYSGGAAATANITFNYLKAENTMTLTPTGALGVQHWTGTAWNNGAAGPSGSITATGQIGATGTTGVAFATTSTSITQYTPFVLVQTAHPLPVTWLSVSSECIAGDVKVRWSTASEQNADHFNVERSADGTNYTSIGVVTASGNSSTIKNYSFIDPDPLEGIAYYRIRETDFNGTTMFSNQITNNGCGSDISISVYPNPSSSGSGLNITLGGAVGSEVLIVITNMLGQDFYSKVILLSSEEQVIAIDPTHTLAAGVYTVVASSNDAIQKRKIVIQ